MSQSPNILLFLTDDHASWAVGCYGNPIVKTPNMDHLAATGAHMKHAFTPSPVCSPARASLFTGRIPSQHGIHDWLEENSEIGRSHPVLTGQTTLAELLKTGGYQTGYFGKWHCGRSAEPQPGFDRWFSFASQMPIKGEFIFSDQGRPVTHFGHQTTGITDAAVEYVRHCDKTRPFFMTVGYTNTHAVQRHQPERIVRTYRGNSFSELSTDPVSPAQGHAQYRWGDIPAEQSAERRAHYYAAATFIDEQIGRLVDELDNLDALDNTLIIYASDHGYLAGQHGLWEKGNATIPQNFLEECIHVPCLLSWPDGLPSGVKISAPVDHCDLFWTMLDAAGVTVRDEVREQIHSPGRSYLPMIREGGDSSWRDAFFGEYGNARCIRTATHKLIRRYPGPNGHFPDEFYDLVADPRERRNAMEDAALQPVIQALSARLDAYFNQYENPAKSGTAIAEQYACSDGHEPWNAEPK